MTERESSIVTVTGVDVGPVSESSIVTITGVDVGPVSADDCAERWRGGRKVDTRHMPTLLANEAKRRIGDY